MKVGPRQCLLILFLISLAKGISFTLSVDFFSMTMLLLLLLLLLLLIILSLKRRERTGCVVKAVGGLLHYHDIIIINVFFNGNVHFQVCGKHLIGLGVQLMLPKYFHCP